MSAMPVSASWRQRQRTLAQAALLERVVELRAQREVVRVRLGAVKKLRKLVLARVLRT